MKIETHFGGGSNTFFSTNTLLLTTNIYIWSMKTVTTYLYKAPQPHRHSIGLTAKKFRNVSLSDAQLGNQALLASYFSLKPNLLISQEGHIATQMRVLTRQEGHIANRMATPNSSGGAFAPPNGTPNRSGEAYCQQNGLPNSSGGAFAPPNGTPTVRFTRFSAQKLT
jgi:hypothetical protein